MKFFLFLGCILAVLYVNGQGKYAMTYYVDRVVDYNKDASYGADEVLSRWDEYIRLQIDQSITEKDRIRAWVDLDIGWAISNLELAYSRIWQGFNADVFFRTNAFYVSDYKNYPNNYQNQPVMHQIGLSAGYGKDVGRFSYKVAPQFTVGHDSKEIVFDRVVYSDSNYRSLNEEIFQFKNFRTAGLEIQLEIRIIEREKWDFGFMYQFYIRRDFFDFSNQSTKYEWTREEIIRRDQYRIANQYDRIQNRFGFTLGLN